MAIRIGPFLDEHAAAVREFNNRVRGSQGAFEFPETAIAEWLPRGPGRRIFQEQFLAMDGGEVRGGYVLKSQDFSIGNDIRNDVTAVGCYHSALSEGVAEERFECVGEQLLMDAAARQPLLYAFEWGGIEGPVARLLSQHAWKWRAIPSYFRIVNPSPFLRNMETIRTTAWRRFLLSLAAFSGIGWMGIRVYQNLKAKPRRAAPAAIDFFEVFGGWADALWTECAPRYPFLAVRDSATLAALYPGGKFLRMKVSSGGRTIGWAIALDTQMQWNRQFGDMRLGSIIDCLALPEHAPQVVAAARRVLERRGVDLIMCDHSHAAWGAALRDAGFLAGPANFSFGASPALIEKLASIPEGPGENDLYLMRADGNARAIPEFGHTPV
jgi:hypothetical protein